MKKVVIALLIALFASSAVFASTALTLSASPYALELGTSSNTETTMLSEYGLSASAGFAYGFESGANVETELIVNTSFLKDVSNLTEVGLLAKVGDGSSWYGNAICGVNLQAFDPTYSPVFTFGAEGGYKMNIADGIKADFSLKMLLAYPKSSTVGYGYYNFIPAVGIEYSL